MKKIILYCATTAITLACGLALLITAISAVVYPETKYSVNRIEYDKVNGNYNGDLTLLSPHKYSIKSAYVDVMIWFKEAGSGGRTLHCAVDETGRIMVGLAGDFEIKERTYDTTTVRVRSIKVNNGGDIAMGTILIALGITLTIFGIFWLKKTKENK